jgi:RNA 3'-terminal phosphate cyclase (ATP)
VTEVFTGFGEKRTSAESVADQAIQQARAYLAANVPVGEHLADQLLLPIAMAGAGSFVTHLPTEHTRTNILVIARFLPATIALTHIGGDRYRVEAVC